LLDFRSPLIWGSPLAGLVAGAALWLLVGGPGGPDRALDQLSQSGGATARGAAVRDASGAAMSVLASRPIFADAATGTPKITLVGVSRTPGRTAALLAIAGGEPRWVTVGETVDGLTLVSVRGAGAVLDSLNGPVTVPLGETLDPASPAAPAAAQEGGPPPGSRLPPEPASAPRP
jgi:hypothetical protein